MTKLTPRWHVSNTAQLIRQVLRRSPAKSSVDNDQSASVYAQYNGNKQRMTMKEMDGWYHE